MTEPSRYEIEIRGRATPRLLHPVIDDFRIEPTAWGTTRLVGDVLDASHLHGLLAHFTSMNVEVVGLHRLGPNGPIRSSDPPRPIDSPHRSRPIDSPHPSQPTEHEEGTTP